MKNYKVKSKNKWNNKKKLAFEGVKGTKIRELGTNNKIKYVECG